MEIESMSSGLKQTRKDKLQNWLQNLRDPGSAKVLTSLEANGYCKTGVDEFGRKVIWLTPFGLKKALETKA